MGMYIEQAISGIPNEEKEEAIHGGYPIALVIAAEPYRTQIVRYLERKEYILDAKHESEDILNRKYALAILKQKQNSNLGWRVILKIDNPPFLANVIYESVGSSKQLINLIPKKFRESILSEVAVYQPDKEVSEARDDYSANDTLPRIRITSFEDAKGLSAQHVFIAGLQDGDFPRDPAVIKDLEICKLIVGLTRTRKKCYLIYTKNFGGEWKSRSSFISWIRSPRLEEIKVTAKYWKRKA